MYRLYVSPNLIEITFNVLLNMHLLKGLDAHLYSFFNVYLLSLLASRNAQNWAIKVKDE